MSLMQPSPVIDNETGIPTTEYEYVYASGTEIDFWALINKSTFEIFKSWYYPAPEGSPDLAGLYPGSDRGIPSPEISPKFMKEAIMESGGLTGILKLSSPYKGSKGPRILSVEPVFDTQYVFNPEKGFQPVSELVGYILSSKNLRPRLPLLSNDIPTCIVMDDPNATSDEAFFDKVDHEYFDKVTPGTFTSNKEFGGSGYFAARPKGEVQSSANRVCPDVPLFNATDELMVGYIKLCGLDPDKYDVPNCIAFRIDRPMSMVDQGTNPVLYLSIEIIGVMIILCAFFILFLDLVVLRRIVNLSNVIRKQTRGHAEALKDTEDDVSTVVSARDDENESRKSHGGRKGRSAHGASETTTSSEGGAAPVNKPTSARDEIGDLKRVMEQNAAGLRHRLEVVNDSIRIEQQKTQHHKQAMQLLNLWCGRRDYFPGLRPNAMQLRYEPTRSLDDLLANPLAIEYLKSHCDNDRTLENLWFLLDVSWLEELETAEDKEEDPEKRKQIHQVANTCAMTILSRYIAENAPQQINISAAAFRNLRDKGDVYKRGMFEGAVSEVKLMLNTDILPRFQKSTAYSAMSETLYMDSAGGGDESEFSDETVSTAGSILTDEGEEGEGGVARVFAHTFKNLHNTFDVGHDNDASSSYSGDSAGATRAAPAKVLGGTQTTTGVRGAASSSDVGSSVSDDDEKQKKKEEPKKEEPKKEEPKKEEPKKEEAKKEEAGNKNESDGSSDSSISSDTMTLSSSSSDE